MKKVFYVSVSKGAYVYAEDVKEAIEVFDKATIEYAYDTCFDSELLCADVVTDVNSVPSHWKNALPFGDQPNDELELTVAELLKKD